MRTRWTTGAPLGLVLGALAAAPASCGSAESPCPATATRETICVARSEGGQTGMEGSCLKSPEPEPFSAEQVRALLAGTRSTTLAYRPEQRVLAAPLNAAEGAPLSVRVELQGEARIAAPGESCQPRITQDIVVTLGLEEPPLDVMIETTAHAFSSTFAVAQNPLEASVAAALGLPRAKATLSIAFHADGVRGTIDPSGGCGYAAFPADARCPIWAQTEVDLDGERAGVRPQDALPELYDLSNVPLRWSDESTTTLSASLSAAPDWACGNSIETACPETLRMPVSLQVTAADGSIAAELPAELSVSISTQYSAAEGLCGLARTAGEIEDAKIIASNVRVPASALGAQQWPAEAGDAALSLRLFMNPERTYAEADVVALALQDPGLTAPLDATIDPAQVSCVVAPSRSGPDDAPLR